MPVSHLLIPSTVEIANPKGSRAGKIYRYLRSLGSLLKVQVEASAAQLGTVETAVAFDTVHTIKANAPEAGSVYRGRAWGKHTLTTGSEVHTNALKIGSTTIGVSGNIDPADADYWQWDWEIVYRDVGASGHIIASATLTYGASAAAGTVLKFWLDSTVIDTTADADVAVVIDRQASATDTDSMRQDSYVMIGHG